MHDLQAMEPAALDAELACHFQRLPEDLQVLLGKHHCDTCWLHCTCCAVRSF
jgi:hypothetical protein